VLCLREQVVEGFEFVGCTGDMVEEKAESGKWKW